MPGKLKLNPPTVILPPWSRDGSRRRDRTRVAVPAGVEGDYPHAVGGQLRTGRLPRVPGLPTTVQHHHQGGSARPQTSPASSNPPSPRKVRVVGWGGSFAGWSQSICSHNYGSRHSTRSAPRCSSISFARLTGAIRRSRGPPTAATDGRRFDRPYVAEDRLQRLRTSPQDGDQRRPPGDQRPDRVVGGRLPALAAMGRRTPRAGRSAPGSATGPPDRPRRQVAGAGAGKPRSAPCTR